MKKDECSKEFIQNSPVCAIYLSREKKVEFANETLLGTFKLSKNSIKGIPLNVFLAKHFTGYFSEQDITKICDNKSKHIIVEADEKYFRIQCFPVNIEGEHLGFVVFFTDITEEERTKKRFAREKAMLNKIIKFIPDMLFAIDKKGKVIVWNRAAEEMTGVKKEEILGKGNYEYAIPIYGKRRPLLIDYALKNKVPEKGMYLSVKKKGDTISGFTDKAKIRGKNAVLWGKASPFYGKNGTVIGAIEIVRDITEMKKMEERLRYLAERDPLTGVFNRRQLAILLEREIERSNRTNTPLTIFYIDIDNMKEINDNFGHAEGDNLLKTIASVFTEGLRKIDIVARIGGDEFVVVLPSAKGKDAVRLIERLRKKLRERLKDKPYDVDFSYGAYEFNPLTPISVEKMLTESDTKMYKMKKSKKQNTK